MADNFIDAGANRLGETVITKGGADGSVGFRPFFRFVIQL